MTHARSSTLPGDHKRLWVKAIQLGQIRRHLKYVDYWQAQRDCEALAGQLLEAYSMEALHDFSFVAIPRGGLFEGVEADMWRTLIAYGSIDASLAYLAGRQGMNESSFRARLETFVEHLVAEGLIEPA